MVERGPTRVRQQSARRDHSRLPRPPGATGYAAGGGGFRQQSRAMHAVFAVAEGFSRTPHTPLCTTLIDKVAEDWYGWYWQCGVLPREARENSSGAKAAANG